MLFPILLVALPLFTAVVAACLDDHRLTFNSPGQPGNTKEEFKRAIPIGNGRLGASIYGHPTTDVITINEDSIWDGPEQDRLSRTALAALMKVQSALLVDDVTTAAHEALGHMAGTPTTSRQYSFLGDLQLNFTGNDDFSNYERYLDMQNATIGIEFEAGSQKFSRQWFSSFPSRTLVGRIASSKAGGVSFDVAWARTGTEDGTKNGTIYGRGSDSVVINAQCQSGPPHFVGKFTVETKQGNVTRSGTNVFVRGATEVFIYLAVETDYWNEGFSPCRLEFLVNSRIASAVAQGFEKLFSAHIADHRHFYDRTSLSIQSPADITAAGDTTSRWAAFTTSGVADYGLLNQFFNFGRYLLIASSRKGSLPPNLLGIWNNEHEAAWGGKFTVNLNVEMNHWLAETTGLSEMHQQLFDFTSRRVAPNGAKTAKIMYNCSGWVSHHNNDLWGDTAPHDNGTRWSFWPTGGAWPMTHLFEHYRFTGDKKFLRDTALPIMEGIVEFFNCFLIERDGYLVTAPSLSPETSYITPDGIQEAISIGPTSDNQILTELYSNFIAASKIVDSTYLVEEAKATLSKIRSPVVRSYYGGIAQWFSDWTEGENSDGMFASLLALHPFSQVNFWDSPPEWVDWALTGLNWYSTKRKNGCSWCDSWASIYWSRLRNGDEAFIALKRLFSEHLTTVGAIWTTNANVSQIDGNFGGVAALVEMLLQSHGPDNEHPMYILPALPSDLASGSVIGLGARGGFEVSIWWRGGKFKKAEVISKLGHDLNLTVGNLPRSEFRVARVQSNSRNLKIPTNKGGTYTILPVY